MICIKKRYKNNNNTYSDSSRQMSIIDEKYEKKNIITLNDSSPKTKITICNMSNNKMDGNIDLQQGKFIRNHKDYAAENTVKISVKIF